MYIDYNGYLLKGGNKSNIQNIENFKEEMIKQITHITNLMSERITNEFNWYGNFINLLKKFVDDYSKTLSFENNIPAMKDYYKLMNLMRSIVTTSNLKSKWLAARFADLCIYLGDDLIMDEFDHGYKILKEEGKSEELFSYNFTQQTQDQKIKTLHVWNKFI